MKRRPREKIAEGVRLSQRALTSLRASKLHPGFDYSAAILELGRHYSQDQIAEFCGYGSKASISKIASGKSVPLHPQGELLYILYVETFGKKPLGKRFQE